MLAIGILPPYLLSLQKAVPSCTAGVISVAVFPALAVFVLCLVANVAGDTLRDLVDR